MRLVDHPQFKEDYKKYQEAVSKISNEEERKKFVNLLNQFLHEVRNIDDGHEDLIFKGKLPDSVNDSKRKLVSLRKSLDTSLSLINKS